MTPINRIAPFSTFFIRRKIFGQKIPLLADIKLTYRCNLACVACPFHRRAGEEHDQMSCTSAMASLDTLKRLGAMIRNDWRCHDDLLMNVDPDGAITRGCYVKRRGRIHCRACGFSAVSEASGALDLLPGSLKAGWSIFLK